MYWGDESIGGGTTGEHPAGTRLVILGPLCPVWPLREGGGPGRGGTGRDGRPPRRAPEDRSSIDPLSAGLPTAPPISPPSLPIRPPSRFGAVKVPPELRRALRRAPYPRLSRRSSQGRALTLSLSHSGPAPLSRPISHLFNTWHALRIRSPLFAFEPFCCESDPSSTRLLSQTLTLLVSKPSRFNYCVFHLDLE